MYTYLGLQCEDKALLENGTRNEDYACGTSFL